MAVPSVSTTSASTSWTQKIHSTKTHVKKELMKALTKIYELSKEILLGVAAVFLFMMNSSFFMLGFFAALAFPEWMTQMVENVDRAVTNAFRERKYVQLGVYIFAGLAALPQACIFGAFFVGGLLGTRFVTPVQVNQAQRNRAPELS